MKLSEVYINSVEQKFGKLGTDWIKKVPNLIELYVTKFELKNVKLLKDLTYNVILFGENEKYGEVVLKIELPFKELTIRESTALNLNNGLGACKCYYSNIEDNILLLEKLQGDSLSKEQNIIKRIKVFADVSSKFNIEIKEKEVLPSYEEILNRSIIMATNEKEKYEKVQQFLLVVKELYNELKITNKCNFLLHSDLFPDNIIETDEGWKAIDPHGFIGMKLMDSAIFIEKELNKLNYDDKAFDNIFSLMEKYYNPKKDELIRALFVNYVLNICWDIEVNMDQNHINECANNAEKILNYLSRKTLSHNILKKTKN